MSHSFISLSTLPYYTGFCRIMKCFLQILGKTVIKFYLLILLLYKKSLFSSDTCKKTRKKTSQKGRLFIDH
ncbi:hypothetical protein FQS90_01240 [Enterococcus casseliflavus]|nr:hypothetical protein CXM95_01560 [Enterococcus sp. CR-Ec1]MBO1095173.1 hypothetical protein [Enterococcus casseliflavus]MBO1120569.1 hypothetical protein [Enterococcus casseliflavus]MBO1143177.1 hypothetical protein [Enterococcus casseliflavus]